MCATLIIVTHTLLPYVILITLIPKSINSSKYDKHFNGMMKTKKILHNASGRGHASIIIAQDSRGQNYINSVLDLVIIIQLDKN